MLYELKECNCEVPYKKRKTIEEGVTQGIDFLDTNDIDSYPDNHSFVPFKRTSQ